MKVYSLSSSLAHLERLFDLPALRIEHDIQGKTFGAEAKFWVAFSPEQFYFAAMVNRPADCERQHHAGQFVEGLWERDVAEVFIREEHSQRYQEFNLSPAGAWWTQTFAEYRVRETSSPEKTDLENTRPAITSISDSAWQAALVLPRKTIQMRSSFDTGVLIHIAAILGSSPRIHLSSHHPAQPKADFHQADCFQRAEVVPFQF